MQTIDSIAAFIFSLVFCLALLDQSWFGATIGGIALILLLCTIHFSPKIENWLKAY